MTQNYMQGELLPVFLFICLMFFSGTSIAEEQVFDIEIPAQDAASSLEMLAEQTGAITLFPYDVASSAQANAVKGRYTLEDALSVLLKDSGLLAGLSSQRVITIEEMMKAPNEKEEQAMLKPPSKTSKVLAVLSSILMSVGINAHESEELGAHLLEEVRVTARKTEESLMFMPLSITTYNTQQLQDYGIKSVLDLAETTPGFQIENDLGRRLQRPVMRGIENSRPEAAQPVSIYVDGIFTRSGLYSFLTESIERVEIVKGPQAGLSGRSTNGGVVNYISKRPEQDFSGSLAVSIAEHGNLELDAFFSGALSEKLSASLGLHHYEYGGEYSNQSELVKGARDVGSEKTDAIYAALFYEPVERLELVARAYYSEDRDGQIAAQFKGCELELEACFFSGFGQGEVSEVHDVNVVTSLDAGTLLGLGDDDTPYLSQWDYRAGLDRAIGRVAANVRYNFNNGMSFEWLGAYTKEEINDVSNQSYAPYVAYKPFEDVSNFLFVSVRDESSDIEYFSNELNLSGQLDVVEWMVGLSLYQEKRKTRIRSLLDSRFSYYYNIDDLEESSLFVQTKFPWGDKVSMSLEASLTNETYTYTSFGNPQEFDNTSLNPRVTVDYKLSENSYLYSSISSGQKLLGRGLQADERRVFQGVFGKEVVKQFESGIKATLANGHVRLQAAAYWLEQEEQKISVLSSSIPNPNYQINLPNRELPNQTDIRGLELGFEWLLNDEWYVGANYALNDAEFSDAMSFGVLPLNGFQRPRVSRHALNARLQYSKALKENWGSKTSLNVVYNSSRQGDAESAIETGDQLDVNFRTSLTKNNLEFSLWMDNVLDDKTPSNAIDSFSFGEPGYITFLPRGRQAGVSLNYSF